MQMNRIWRTDENTKNSLYYKVPTNANVATDTF